MSGSRSISLAQAMIEAAAVIHRLLDAIDKGEIDADGPKGRALHRRLEGVVAAWEEAAGERVQKRE